MSHVREHAAAATTDAPAIVRARRRRVVARVAVAVALVALGYAVGVRSPWSAHHPRVVDGTAVHVPSQPRAGLFRGEDGTRVWFRLENVSWRTGTTSTSDGFGTIPSCLRRPDREVRVRATVIEIARPFGSGSYEVVHSVTC